MIVTREVCDICCFQDRVVESDVDSRYGSMDSWYKIDGKVVCPVCAGTVLSFINVCDIEKLRRLKKEKERREA